MVSYKTTDINGKLQNSIEVKKDTLHYRWLEKDKITARMLVGDTTLESKLITIMDKHEILKFKSEKPTTKGSTVVFTHAKAGKQKSILILQNIKIGSKKEVFVKEFLEAVVIKVFAQEIKNFPK